MNSDDAVRVVECKTNSEPTPAVGPSSKFQAADETVSAVFESAGRNPVVFLHSNSSTKDLWAHQIDAVRNRGHALLAPDLPGHGESPDAQFPERTYSLPGYAAVIGSLLDQMKWTSVDVIGWSLGGHVGLELLATDRRVRSSLIVGTPPVPMEAQALGEAFNESEVMGLTGKRDFSESDAFAYGCAIMGGEQFLTSEMLRNVKRADGRAREMLLASVAHGIGADELAAAETVDKPLCVVHGEQDAFVRLDYLQKVRYRALWRNRIFVISGAGHAPHWQCPGTFNEILLEFLDGQRSG
jgi:pimeloyl-ACP methyl ester carboxylesterase